MPWNYFPLSTGSQISIEVVSQELVDAINERCVWAGIAQLTEPAIGDNWFTGTNIKQIQQKIEDLVPLFVDPTANISGATVTFDLWDWDSLLASMPSYFDTNDWHAITSLQQLEYRQATGGDKGTMNKLGAAYSFWRQMYHLLDALRYTDKTVAWASDNQDWRWMSNRPQRNFTPPSDVTGVLDEADAQTYVQNHWASGAWWDLSSGVPPVPNSTNGPYLAMNNQSFYKFDDSMKWGQARWIRDASGVYGPGPVAGPGEGPGQPFDPAPLDTPPSDACEIEIMRARNNLTSSTIVSGTSMQVFGYQTPFVHGADYVRGVHNTTTTTGTPEKILISADHTSGTLLASGLGYDDTRPTPTPALSDIGGGYSARMDETYYELSTEVLIEINFDKLT